MHYKLISGGSNNKETFKDFVIEMVRKVKGEAVVYMDNLTVHHAMAVRECFNERVLPRYLPKYSCTLNPIENLTLQSQSYSKEAIFQEDLEVKSSESYFTYYIHD